MGLFLTPAVRLRRRLLTAIGALALLAVLCSTCDSALRTLAESGAEAQVRQAEPDAGPPQVRISGTPFLLGAARGRLEQVQVILPEAPLDGEVTVDRMTVTAQDVRLSVTALLTGTAHQVTAGPVEATAVLGYPEVDGLLGGQSRYLDGVRCADGGGGRLRCTATADLGARARTVEMLASVTLSGSTVSLTAVPGSVTGVPVGVARALGDRLRVSVDLGPLPLGLRPTDVTVGPGGLELAARAPVATLDLT